MKILAIQEAHDSSAVIMINGEVIAACQEERFTRLKGDYGYPKNSIKYCLEEANITAQELDAVALCSLNWNPVLVKIKRNANFSVKDWRIEQEKYWRPTLLENKKVNYYDLFKDRKDFKYDNTYPMDHLLNGYMDSFEMSEMQKIRKQTVAKELDILEDKIVFVRHEDCHKYYAYYANENKGELILTAEGIGDYSNGTVSIINQNNFILELSSGKENHIGHLYQYVCLLLGLKPANHEYKVMGLAPYANSKEVEKSYQVYKDILKVDGLDIVFDKKPKDLYFHFREAFEGHRFDGIAGAIQKVTEELLCQWVKNCIKHTGINRISFAGGVSQNIKACKAISELDEVEDINVLPASGDASLPIGACYYIAYMNNKNTKSLTTAYLGPRPDGSEIKKVIRKYRSNGFDFIVSSNIRPEKIAGLLMQNKIIARCSGRMEFGHRALGNRSIMANPKDIRIVKKINDAIKFRDFWMPFTPSICDYKAKEYIINPKNLNTKFMTMAFDSTKKAQEEIPAALHPADLTMRPQVIKYDDNPKYYDIIDCMGGTILNTSFNLHGEPIVNTSEDAMRTFFNSGLDGLILGDLLITKVGAEG